MHSDDDLIRGIKARDPGSFEIYVRRFQRRVYFTALRMLGDREEALDASQEVFLKVWRFAPKLNVQFNLERWTYRIAINACIDRLRTLPRAEIKVDEKIIDLARIDRSAGPAERAAQSEDWNELQLAMESLTEKQRAVFVLRHFQNLKMNEIAEAMGLSVGTVKATLHQTLKKLRGLLCAVNINHQANGSEDQ
ncbi:MAG: sigma-70 family RNA polymerase sigma factor [Candidatus Hinthialibacter antarcticus]|nr:sigma-70 family RNA polymerase sigma factor [Candidatus Hinthialibacter antarcticus]